MIEHNTPPAFEVPDDREVIGGSFCTVAEQQELGVPIYAMDESWIKIYRRLTESDIWQMKPEYLKIWIYLLIRANRAPSIRMVKGVQVTINRGEVLTSLERIAMDCLVSVQTVRSCLKWCSINRLCVAHKSHKVTHLTILKYDELQGNGVSNVRQKSSKSNASQQYIENIRSKEEENKEYTSSVSMRSRAFTPPSFEEVEAFFTSLFRHDLAQPYFDYYTSNGWRVGKNPMKNWQSAARNWIRNEAKYKQSQGSSNAQPRRGDRERTDTETYYEQLANIAVKSVRQRSGTDGMVHKVIGQIEQSAGLAIGAEQSRSDT
jgi:hypothetical protein